MAAATCTAATLRLIGILDREASSHRAVLEIDCRAVEVQREHLLRHERHAVVIVLRIDCGIELLVEPKSVLQPLQPPPPMAIRRQVSSPSFSPSINRRTSVAADSVMITAIRFAFSVEGCCCRHFNPTHDGPLRQGERNRIIHGWSASAPESPAGRHVPGLARGWQSTCQNTVPSAGIGPNLFASYAISALANGSSIIPSKQQPGPAGLH